jgi:putative membrane protein
MRPTAPSVPATLLKGFCMGAADVVPGVSGGTMALILGIYERLLSAIRHVDLAFIGLLLRGRLGAAASHVDLAFLALLGTGILAALLFFTRVVSLPRLVVEQPELIYGLFFGLIVASVGVLLQRMHPRNARHLGLVAVGIALGLMLVTLVPVQTPTDTWFIFLCGALAICAMILPGVSGSFILLVLQKYAYVFDALGRLDLTVIVPFALGCAAGLAAFSRVLGWLLARHHDATLLVIVGVLSGSLWTIWPFQERVYEIVRGKQRLMGSSPALPAQWDGTTWGALALALAGMLAVFALHAAAQRRGRGA